MAVPYFMWLLMSFSLHWHGIIPRAVHIGFVVGKIELGQVSSYYYYY
jgi:hypothetical protein